VTLVLFLFFLPLLPVEILFCLHQNLNSALVPLLSNCKGCWQAAAGRRPAAVSFSRPRAEAF
jgi:hypothetical protein